MKQLQQEAFFVPLWISDAEIKAPPLCGAVPCHPDHVCEAGHRVAARIKSGMNADDWIVAEVTIFLLFYFLKVRLSYFSLKIKTFFIINFYVIIIPLVLGHLILQIKHLQSYYLLL